VTTLSGLVPDQAALRGILNKLWDLNLTPLLSLVLYYWVNHPQACWLNWVMGVAFLLLMALPIVGLLVS
jgi:hypothetical protein